ncbi:MAG: outer membrane protein assembly factor BamE [Rubrivivax sp.]|nr:outer membrane protein assembly factor BamE [Rubrivivax sp.]
MRRSFLPLSGSLAAVLLLAGCASSLPSSSNFLGLITPYRIDIVQGNVVTREQMARVKPGMTRVQVRELLGSPMLTDLFHANRWDYIFTIRRPGTEPQRRSVVLVFEGEALKTIVAPELPSEHEFVASISPLARSEPKVLELSEDQRKALPVPAKREAPAAEPVGPVRDYPPLETP